MNNNRLKAHAISALVTLALTAALFIYSPATAQNTPTNSRAPGPTTAATTGPTAPPETPKATLKILLTLTSQQKLLSVSTSPTSVALINQMRLLMSAVICPQLGKTDV